MKRREEHLESSGSMRGCVYARQNRCIRASFANRTEYETHMLASVSYNEKNAVYTFNNLLQTHTHTHRQTLSRMLAAAGIRPLLLLLINKFCRRGATDNNNTDRENK